MRYFWGASLIIQQKKQYPRYGHNTRDTTFIRNIEVKEDIIELFEIADLLS